MLRASRDSRWSSWRSTLPATARASTCAPSSGPSPGRVERQLDHRSAVAARRDDPPCVRPSRDSRWSSWRSTLPATARASTVSAPSSCPPPGGSSASSTIAPHSRRAGMTHRAFHHHGTLDGRAGARPSRRRRARPRAPRPPGRPREGRAPARPSLRGRGRAGATHRASTITGLSMVELALDPPGDGARVHVRPVKRSDPREGRAPARPCSAVVGAPGCPTAPRSP